MTNALLHFLEENRDFLLVFAGAVFSAAIAGVGFVMRANSRRFSVRATSRKLVAGALDVAIYALEDFRVNLTIVGVNKKITDQLDDLEITTRNFRIISFPHEIKKWIRESEFIESERSDLEEMFQHIEMSGNFFKIRCEMLISNIKPKVRLYQESSLAGLLTRFFTYEVDSPDSYIVSYVSDLKDEIGTYVLGLKALQSAIASHTGLGGLVEDPEHPFPSGV